MQNQKKNCSTQSIRQHHKQKLQKGKSGKRIQIKILRIADRSKHTAKVCSHGHKGDKKYFFCSIWHIRRSRMPNGTKVIRATSLVISMLQKKHREIRSRATIRSEFTCRRRLVPSQSNTPHSRRPATISIRQNSRIRV